MSRLSLTGRFKGAVVPMSLSGLPGLLCMVMLAGCWGPYFDVTETLPAHPGVSSKVIIMREGKERSSILRNHGVEHEKDRVVAIQQVIRNGSDDDLRLFRLPPFEAELIVVKNAEGDRVPLNEKGREFARTRRDPGRGTSKIPAHDTQKETYILTEWYDLSEPGTYTVEIESRYQVVDKAGTGYFETNPEPITFEVK